jgi:pyruvate dehydrogenase E2 component (dihydrolipoamide acetyltransferase)
MAISVVMPALEMAQETGKLLAWRKKEGDQVTKGEPLLEIETDKVVLEVEAPGDGILAGVTSFEGADVPVGQTIAWIVAPGEQPPASASTAAPAARAVTEPARSAPAFALPPSPASADAPKISPKARRLAKELGVDLAVVQGTGPDGVITGEDVQRAAESPHHGLSTIARLMAERTTQSWTTTPHFFLVREINSTGLVAARQQHGAEATYTDLLVALVARVVAKHPKMNASWTGDAIRLNPDVNISIAIAVKDGVVGGVIPNAGAAGLGDIAKRRRDLTDRARAGRLHPPDISGATFTISNLGMFGIDAFSAIITPPQAAVLAVGRIADRVVVDQGQPVVRPMMTITLSSDHRVVDGAQAATFLNELAGALEAPQAWLA